MTVSKFTILLDNRISACEAAGVLSSPPAIFKKKDLDEKLKSIATLQSHDPDLSWPGRVQCNVLCMQVEETMRSIMDVTDFAKKSPVHLGVKLWQMMLPVLLSSPFQQDGNDFKPNNPCAWAVVSSLRDEYKTKAFQGGDKDEMEEECLAMEAWAMDSLLDALGSDTFFSMLSNLNTNDHKQKIAFIFQQLLAAVQAPAVQEAVAAETEPVRDIVERMIFVGKALVVLCCQTSGASGTRVADLAALYTYRGKNDFEVSVKLILGQNKILSAEIDQILKTASADVKLGHLPQVHMQKIGSATAVSFPGLLSEALKDFERLQSELRPGATAELQKMLIQESCARVGDVISTEDVTNLKASQEEIDAVAECLSFFQREEGCLDTLHRLRQWQKKHKSALVSKGLHAYLQDLEKRAEAVVANDGNTDAMSVQELDAKLSGAEKDEQVKFLLVQCMPLMLRTLVSQAAFTCLR